MATAYQPLSRRLQSFLRCSTCLKLGETKVLPCKHWLCQSCIFDICSKKDGNGQSTCLLCDSRLDRKPDQYLACRVIQYFQKHQREIEGLLEEVANGGCMAEECIQTVTKICRQCKKMYCSETRHQDNCSVATDGVHGFENLNGYCKEIRVSFDQWVAKKKELIHVLKVQKDETIFEIRQKSQQLVDASSEEIQQLTAVNVPMLSQLEAGLYQLNERILEEKTTLQFIQGVTDGIMDVELMVIYNHLKIHDQKQTVSLGQVESLTKGFDGCDIAWSPAGHLLIAKDGGIDVVEITTNGTATVINTLLEGEDIFSIDVFKENILAAISVGNPYSSTTMVTLNNEYKETRRWSASIQAIDFAITDNKIVFSMMQSPNLKVYSMLGRALPDVLWETSVAGICGAFSNSVVLADKAGNKVCRKQISEGKCTDPWTAEVKKPYSVCVDAKELVWVRSNNNDCITILSRRGEKVQEIEDKKLTDLAIWGGIMVHDGYLYVTHANGVGRFKITYIDT